MENIILSSTPIEVSEFANHKEATFLISVLDEYNLNNVLIRKEEGEKYHNTIVGYPILAYLKYDKDGKPEDFGGHELRTKYNKESKEIEYYFATFPIGSVTDSWIEEREVYGYEGKKNVILIKAKLWKSRFPEYFKVFDKLWKDGNILSSWEISVFESEKTTKGKILKVFEFIGNCLLGSKVTGAVKGAGVLEVASNDDINYELSNALLLDIQKQATENSETGKDKVNEGGEEMPKNGNAQASLTENDIYSKVKRAINSVDENKYFYVSMVYPYEYRAIAHTWERASEEDFVEFTYSVNSDDTISIVSQKDVKLKFIPVEEIETQVSKLQEKLSSTEKEVAEAGKSITQLIKEKEDLEAQIAELTPFKEKVEQLEAAEKERQLVEKTEELKSFALEDELITSEELESDEQLSTIFAELTLDNFELSQEKIELIKGRRAIQKFKATKETSSKEETVETSQVTEKTVAKTDLNNGDESGFLSATDVIKAMLGK